MSFASCVQTFNSVENFLHRCGLTAKKVGGKYFISCPNPGHPDQNPSCTVSERNGWISLHCWSRGCSTDEMLSGLGLEKRDLCLNPTTITRPPRLEPLTKPKPQTPGPDPQPQTPRITFRDLADYAERSTPNPVNIEAYRLAGWHNTEFKGRRCIAIPLASGETKYRNLEADGPKYFNPIGEGKGRGWYGLNRAAQMATNGIGIHTNGEASAVVGQFFGLPAFASMAGESTPPTPEMLDQVKAAGFNHIILAPDADEPGHKGAERTAAVYRAAGFTVSVRNFGPDQAKGFDLRDFCSIHREHSFEKLTDLAEIHPEPKAEPESKPEVRRWFGSDQARFAHAYLSQLGLSARSKNTILLILALLNGHTTGKISNFVLGYFSGRIESGDFDNLELDALHPDHSDSKKKIADRGSKLWKALNRDQERMGVELIQRISGGQNNGERESSTYIVVFGDEMNRIIEETRMKKLPFKPASTELNRRARALADSQFTARAEVGVETDLPEKIIKGESESEKIERKTVEYLKFIERRKAMGLIDEATAYAILGSVAMATVGQAKAQVVLGALAMATQDPEPAEAETCDEPTPYSKEGDTFLSEIEERVLMGIQAESDSPSDENDDWEPPVQAEESVFWVVNLSTQTENEIIDSGGLNLDEFSGNAVNSDTLTTLSEIEERVLVGIQAESDLPPDENDDWEPPVQAEKSVFWVDRLSTQTENEIIDSGGLNLDEFSENAVNSDTLTTLSEIEERVLVGIQAESDLPPDENDDWEPPVQAEKSVFWVVNLSTQTENEIIDSGGLNLDEFSGNAVNPDTLTTLENELELPPGTFQNELKFICEEPKETRRAFARERYQKLRDHLEKCAPNFGFSDLRQKFRFTFGRAIRDLLEKTNMPDFVELFESS